MTDAAPYSPTADSAEWLKWYRELGEPVFRLVHRMTGDVDLAGDITQDTFVRAVTRRSQLSAEASYRGWIFRIATNLVRERGRTEGHRAALLEAPGPVAPVGRFDTANAVVARITLARALDELSDDLRAALLLHEVDGFTHAEIAEMYGLAEGSSRARVSRAKAQLRALLEGDGT